MQGRLRKLSDAAQTKTIITSPANLLKRFSEVVLVFAQQGFLSFLPVALANALSYPPLSAP